MAKQTTSRQAGNLWTAVTLFPSQAITADTNVITTDIGWAKQALILFELTNAATDVGDLLDVYVDISPDFGTTWINAVRFTRILGNGADAFKEWAFLNPEHTGTTTVDVTTDAAEATVRQLGLTDRIRARADVTADGDPVEDQTFSLSVVAFLKG